MDEIKTTPIFKRLKKLDKAFAYKVLENTNAIVELINKKTTINFPNYTNHDVHHSINIINFMYELIKKNINDFNELELALMIYSAMYHDIGMALDDNEIEKIKSNESKYLYKKDFASIKNSNNDDENLALQEIIRVSHGKIANDLITTKYKDNFNFLNSSINFAKELGQICEAHTRDKDYLNNIKQKDTKGTYDFNARFIAVLLRVADILDIDANRTPLELYNAMNLNNYSDDEWHKNFSISNTKKIFIKNKRKYVKLNGECSDIKIHRKLLEYIKWIENELKLAVDITSDMKKKYQIDIRTEVENNLEANGYTIPDLKLNMDYHAVTNLLMGESIYGSKDMGLRELIQNSIDACMVKKEKLDNENPNNKYEPTIDINIDEENNEVTIEDNGMGMNEHIIKNYFLNVGKSYYKSKDFLDYKHEYSPIGNFGIGFLSCFMLSPEVKVITKYYGESKKYKIDIEQNSEYISFNDVEENKWESGTKIILNLESFKNAFTGYKDLESQIKEFLQNNILIKYFTINIDNDNVQNKMSEIEPEYKIELSEKLEGVEGYISINKKKSKNKIQEHIKGARKSYFFDGKAFIQINCLEELELSTIYNSWSGINYFRIPLLNKEESIKIKQTMKYDFDFSSVKDLSKYEYVNIFISKEYYIPVNDNQLYTFNFDLDSHDNVPLLIMEEDLKSDIEILKDYYITVFLVENFNFIFDKNNNLLPIKNYQLHSSRNEFFQNGLYHNGIKLENHSNNYMMLLDIIEFKSFQINIKNEILQSNISRQNLVEKSQEILRETIGKLILEYVLENFGLTPTNKMLVQEFIDKYYPVKSILLK